MWYGYSNKYFVDIVLGQLNEIRKGTDVTEATSGWANDLIYHKYIDVRGELCCKALSVLVSITLPFAVEKLKRYQKS